MKRGTRIHSKNLVIFVRKNEKGFHRLGVIVKKEVGTAVFRNRLKRYFREYFRIHKHQMSGELDLIILVKKECSINRYRDAEMELKRLLPS
jgi:ribonuclease P protein component